MEAASVLVKIAETVTIICSTEEPLPAFGNDIGKALRKAGVIQDYLNMHSREQKFWPPPGFEP